MRRVITQRAVGHGAVTRVAEARMAAAPAARSAGTRPANVVEALTGLRPSPTRHAVVVFRFQGRLPQGLAVRAADRRHPLRQGVLTWTGSAYGQVRCAVVALWSGHEGQYADQIGPARTEFDSILTASPVLAF